MARHLILSCDGGGIRGYLSSLLLQRLNRDLGIFGDNNQNIDFYAGTSTGGLIALALAYGKSIDAVVNLYATEGAQIFNPLEIQLGCFVSQLENLSLPEAVKLEAGTFQDVKEIWQVLYDDIGNPSLRTVLESFVPGNPLLSALTSKVMVATFQLSAPQTNPPSWGPLVIDNLPDSQGGSTHLYDAALSTSAAPVYFPPYQHPQFGWCSDGGLFANNPAALAIGRAIDQGQSLSDIVLLSIGTGITTASLPVSDSGRLCFGLTRWVWFETSGPTPAFPLLNSMMDGVSAANDYLGRQLLGDGNNGGRYMRANPVLPYPIALDDYSPAALKMLEQAAEAYFASPDWKAIEQWIKTEYHR